MPKDYRKENSFQAGEISPLFYGRSETEFYQKGLAVAENINVDKRGGIFRRGGARNRGQITGNDARCFTKQIHPYRFDSLMMRNLQLLIYSPGIATLSANLLNNDKFRTGIGGWSTIETGESRVIGNDNICKLRPQQGAAWEASISQVATVTASTSASHTVRVQQAKTSPIRILIGTSTGNADIGNFETNDELSEFTFVPNNPTYWVTIQTLGTWAEEADIVHILTLATADIGGLAGQFTAPWSEDQIDSVHVVKSPDGNTWYFLHPNLAPSKLTYDFATDTYTGMTTVSFTAIPAAWTGTNYPATGVYASGRLWLFGTPDEPQTGWGSKSGSPEDFTTGAGAADAWEFEIEEEGRVKWAIKVGKRDILIGTENGEHIMTSQDGVISQLDFDISRQSSYGSNKVQPLQVGGKIFYVTPDGRKVQSTAYAWQEDNWLSQDITFSSEHITKAKISRRVWAQNPDSLLLLRLEDDSVVVLTYDRTSETLGWARYLFEDARVLDVAAGTIDGTTRLVYLTKRTTDEIELEIETSVTVYMDSYSQSFSLSGSAIVVNGLDHLDGEVVQMVYDGVVGNSPTVSSGSALLSPGSGTALYAGKQISSKIITLPPGIADANQLRSWIKRYNKIWALTYMSSDPIINGDRMTANSVDIPNPESAESGSVKALRMVNLGYDKNGQITIEEDTPVAMNILAIYGELGRESL